MYIVMCLKIDPLVLSVERECMLIHKIWNSRFIIC